MPAAEVTAYLRSKPPADLFRTLLTKLGPAGRAGSGPIADGTIVATDPVGAIRAGRYVKVPLLLGTTRDEATLFPSLLPMAGGTGTARAVTDAQLFAHHFAHDPDAPAATRIEDWITPGYLPADAPVTGFTARARTLTSLLFDRARDLTLDAVRSQQPQVWYYRFDWDEQPAPWNVIYGATHAGDLPFLFGNFGPSLFSRVSFSAANRPGRVALSDAMMRSTAAFAWRGDPNDPSLGVAWAPWPGRIVFDASTTQARITAP
jgi:para-nitrobenzyl esterase